MIIKSCLQAAFFVVPPSCWYKENFSQPPVFVTLLFTGRNVY